MGRQLTEGAADRPSVIAAAAPGFLSRRADPLAAALLAVLFVQGLLFITESSQTNDEAAHLAAGYSYLKTGDFRLNVEHPPLIKELAALPLLPLRLDFPRGPLWEQADEWTIGRIFVHENRVPNDTILLLGRLPVLLLSILLGWAIYRWGRRLFGAPAALLALALYAFDPNVVAHSGLVTTDLGITLFMFLSVYAFWCWTERPSRRTLALFGLAVGGAFAAKYTSVWLPPILAALGIALLSMKAPLPERVLAPGEGAAAPPATWTRGLRTLLRAAAVVLVVGFAVLALSYGVIGLPAYLDGLDMTLHHSAIGHRAYLMGSVSETGWWYYFPLAWLFKTPPGTILLVAASLLALALGRRLRLKDEVFLAVPLLITLVIACLWKVNIGLRHVLPLYPFLYLGAARLALSPKAPGRLAAGAARAIGALIVATLGWNVYEAVSICPYNLAYFNVFAGGPENGHASLLDSNLDWGQSAKALRRYMVAEGVPMIYCAFNGNSDPWFYGVRYQYVPGSGNLRESKERPVRMPERAPRELLAVNAMVLHSLHFSVPTLYAWLLPRRPVAMPGYSYLVFDITGDAEAHARIALVCRNFGLLDLAEFEAHRALALDPRNRLARAVLEKLAEDVRGSSGGRR